MFACVGMLMDVSREFLEMRVGDFVLIQDSPLSSEDLNKDWWIGQIIYIVTSSINSSDNSMFQVVNVDTGCIFIINAASATRILKSQ